MSFVGDIFKTIAGSFTPDAPQVPGKSPEELALLSEQTAILREQRDQLSKSLQQQNLLQPLLFGELGIQEKKDASGNVIGYEKAPLTPDQQKRADLESRFLDLSLGQLEGVDPAQSAEINKLLGERSLAALKGELPADPGLLRSLDDEEQRLREQLRAQLGPGFETSTPGIQALAEFTKRKTEIIAGAKRGDLTMAEGLGLARGASNMGEAAGATDITERLRNTRFGGIMDTGKSTLPFVNVGTSLAGGFAGPLSSWADQTNKQFQANSMRTEMEMQTLTGFGQLMGQIFGGTPKGPAK